MDSRSWMGQPGGVGEDLAWHRQDLAGSADDGLPCQLQAAQSGGPMSDEETRQRAPAAE